MLSRFRTWTWGQGWKWVGVATRSKPTSQFLNWAEIHPPTPSSPFLTPCKIKIRVLKGAKDDSCRVEKLWEISEEQKARDSALLSVTREVSARKHNSWAWGWGHRDRGARRNGGQSLQRVLTQSFYVWPGRQQMPLPVMTCPVAAGLSAVCSCFVFFVSLWHQLQCLWVWCWQPRA